MRDYDRLCALARTALAAESQLSAAYEEHVSAAKLYEETHRTHVCAAPIGSPEGARLQAALTSRLASAEAYATAFGALRDATPPRVVLGITMLAQWAETLALQAYSTAMALSQADEDGGLDALGDVGAAIARQDIARLLEIVAERPQEAS